METRGCCKISLGFSYLTPGFCKTCFFFHVYGSIRGKYTLVCWWGAGPGAASPVAPASCMSSALPQPCQSPCTPTPALSSGRSMKATAIGTSPSTKPGLKPTSTVLSSPSASDQQSWPPFTGESHGHVLLLGKQGHRHGATEAAQPLCNSWGRPDALGMQRWCRKCLLLRWQE